ncbi:MAG TPA: HisA/HisF-related TIM barrel protein [Candidatus Acidoferrales bacterium]
MIIPCIDLQGGRAVQLVRGRKRVLTIDDVFGLLDRFKAYPILHVIDLDAAMGRGSNAKLIEELCRRAKHQVRVGGGIRTVASAKKVARWGAEKIIIGSAAFKNGAVDQKFLQRLSTAVGKKKIIVALDSQNGRIVILGWKQRLQLRPAEVIPQLERYCCGFLCTYVDHEGTMQGTSLDFYRELRKITKLPITAAGGIHTQREVRALEKLGMDAAVGMAMYRGKLK